MSHFRSNKPALRTVITSEGQGMEETPKSRWIVEALRLHEAALIRYATWVLGDPERAREIVQDTFLRLCKEDPGKISGYLAQWLFTVCRNLAFDASRKEG